MMNKKHILIILLKIYKNSTLTQHIESKIDFYLNKNNHAQVLYGSKEQKELADKIRNISSDFTAIKDILTNEINKFKDANKKLLK